VPLLETGDPVNQEEDGVPPPLFHHHHHHQLGVRGVGIWVVLAGEELCPPVAPPLTIIVAWEVVWWGAV